MIWMIKLYQKAISPYLYPSCRYTPSCSSYALAAIERFGSFKGIFLSVLRILSCNPLFNGGVDLVPNKWPGWSQSIKGRIERFVGRK